MFRRPRSALPAKLAALCAMLGALAAAEIAGGAPPYAAAQAAGTVALAELVPGEPSRDFSLPPLSSFVEITQRPLFNGTRRPALGADQSGQAWSSFVLKGVILSPTTREALVAHATPAAVVSLQEGEALDGWVAQSILPDRVVFRNGSAEHELMLASVRDNPKPADRAAADLPPPPSRPEPPSL